MTAKKKSQKRDASGKKKRWSETRKEKSKAQLYGEAIGKARQLAPAGTPGASFSASFGADPKAKGPGQEGKRTAAAPKRKRRRKEPKPKTVEKSGDVVCEHNWDTSEDEEEIEIKEAEQKKKDEELAAAAKGRRQIFVTGIPWSAEEDAVKKYFERCGEIKELAYPRNEDGRPKGMAFITFPDEDGVARALALDGADWEARKLSVKVAYERKKKGGKGKGKGKGKGSDSEDDDDDDDDDDDESGYALGPGGSDSDSDAGGKGKSKGKGKGKGKGKAKGKGKDKGGGKGKDKGGGKGKSKGKGKGSGKKRKR